MTDVFVSYSRARQRVRPGAARVPDARGQQRLGRLGGHPAGLRVGAGHLRHDRRGRELRLRRHAELARLRVLHDGVPSCAGAAASGSSRSRCDGGRSGAAPVGAAAAELDLVPGRATTATPRSPSSRARSTRISSGRGRTRDCSSARSMGRAPGQQPAAARPRSQAGRAGPRGERGQGAGADRAPAAVRPRQPACRFEAPAAHARRRHGGAPGLARTRASSRGMQRNTANDRAQIARSQGLAAQSLHVQSLDPRRGLALAARAEDTSATPQAEEALRTGLVAVPLPGGPRRAREHDLRCRLRRDRRASSRRRVREARSCSRRPGSW